MHEMRSRTKNIKRAIDKQGDQPKIFYRYTNKLKHRENIVRLRNGNGLYEELKEIDELVN